MARLEQSAVSRLELFLEREVGLPPQGSQLPDLEYPKAPPVSRVQQPVLRVASGVWKP